MRYKEIKKKIQSHYNSLPKNHQKLADYFIDNFDLIPFLTVQNISESTSLSVASVVRFAQRIGFTGFLEMRENIAETLQTQIKNNEIFSLLEKDRLKDDTLTSVAEQDINNINDTLNLIDRKNFDNAINIILESERIFTAGLGISFLLSQILAYQLKQVAVDAYSLTNNQTSFLEQIVYLGKKNVLIPFSFPPYSKETIEAAKFAREKGVKVIAITNKDASPISLFSDIHLTVKSENMLFTNSFAAISVLINTIATECALRNKNNAKKMLDELNRIAKEQDLVLP